MDKKRPGEQRVVNDRRRLFDSLTRRQRNVMQLTFEDFVTRQIAAKKKGVQPGLGKQKLHDFDVLRAANE
jgi:FixJ family two-component response regulator